MFSYSVTPKNLSENVSTASEVKDAFEMLAQHHFGPEEKNGGNFFARALRQRSEQLRSILANPLVVGFASGKQPLETIKSPDGRDKLSVVHTTEFGWIIAPHMRSSEQLVQIDGQYALTAVISVPSWWRSVELDIQTCWISRETLDRATEVKNETGLLCKTTKPEWTIVQLPGAIQELSRKLGFEVVQEPYVTDHTVQDMEVGREGFLVLTGGRLWRSTAVTVGFQSATEISVLPNMEGIIAYFSCVMPQGVKSNRSNGDADLRTSQVSARVWTSEGVTDPTPVRLIWPSKEVELDPRCPARNEKLQFQK